MIEKTIVVILVIGIMVAFFFICLNWDNTVEPETQPDPRQQVTEIKMFCQNLAATTQRDDWKYASCLEELMQEYKVDAGIQIN